MAGKKLELPKVLVARSLAKLGNGSDKEYGRRWVLSHWREIVGDTIASHVKPMGIRQEILYLQSYEPVWQNELRMRMGQIIQLVNNYAGGRLVKEMRFTRPWEHPEAFDLLAARKTEEEREKAEANWGRERSKVPLTEEEMSAAAKKGELCSDPELAKLTATLYRKQLQLKKLQQSKGFKPCPGCGILTEQGPSGEAGLCPVCRMKEAEKLRAGIRQVLRDIPWAHMKEMREYVPEATPALIAEQRALLVQQLAAEVEVNDKESLKAMQLVMLAQGIPPEQLSEDKVARTLYNLRFDMHRPKDYKAPRRYEVIKGGREGEQAKRTIAKGARQLLAKPAGKGEE